MIIEAFEKFKHLYAERLGHVTLEILENMDGVQTHVVVTSEKLKEGNYPTVFFHGHPTQDVIVLTHGLSDSPYYMKAIGKRFYAEGLNVVFPLLPAHGLKDPDKAMEDKALDTKWKHALDQSVEVALSLGERVSLGGFSTGGALSLNKVLRRPEKIAGGVFLFSAALDLGPFAEEAGRLQLIQHITKVVDGKIQGNGPNPYKYPQLPKFAGIELVQIIQENEKLLDALERAEHKITHPVFAAHSVHDTTVKIEGIIELLKNHVKNGVAFIISEDVRHEEVVLAEEIKLVKRPEFGETWKEIKQPNANPKFGWMMDNAIRFFKEYVASKA